MKAYAIADFDGETDTSTFLDRVTRLSERAVDVIQIRAKSLDDADLLELASQCRSRIEAPSKMLINGRADIAVAAGADGVHLPADGIGVAAAREIGPGLVVGRSCHSVGEVRRARSERADYVLLGPVHSTRTGSKPAAVGPADLAEAVGLGIPVYALGGFDISRVERLRSTGVEGVAAITLFMRDEPLDRVVEKVRAVPA